MSTKPCPQCGSAVPLQARFCGQCGHTFTPRTLDDATADPAPAGAPTPRAHAGLPTALGHAVANPMPSPGLGGPPPPAVAPPPVQRATPPPQPAYFQREGMKTQIGRNEEPPPVRPPTFGKTLFDPAPYGAKSGPNEEVTRFDPVPARRERNEEVTSVITARPTPMVPPPGSPAPAPAPVAPPPASERTQVIAPPQAQGIAPPPASERTLVAPPPTGQKKPLAQTMNDPLVAQRAREMRELALQEAHLKARRPPNEPYSSIQDEPTSIGASPSAPAATGSQPAPPQVSAFDAVPPQGAVVPREQTFGRTLLLGGVSASEVMGAAAAATAATPPQPGLDEQTAPIVTGPLPPLPENSPLSRSIVAPNAVQPIKTPVQSTPVYSAPIQAAPVHAAHPSAPPPMEPPPPSPMSPPGALAGTMAIGLAAGSDKQTMLGMPAVELAPSSQGPQGGPHQGPMTAQQAAAQAFAPAMKTMMGVAMPGIAPTHDNNKPPSSGGAQQQGTLQGIAAVQQQQQQHGNRAPTQPLHQQQPSPQQPGAPIMQPQQQHHGQQQQGQQQTPAPPPIVPPPAPLVMEPIPEKPHQTQKKGVPAIAVVAIVFVLVLVVGGGAAYFFVVRAGGPLSAQPQLDETGKESLKIKCDSCPDGTMISLGASSAKVQGGAALLPLPAPLSIGDNDLELNIDRPATGRDETVKIHVPVAYRVKADLSTLTPATGSNEAPAITVRVEALPGTDVSVDGKPITLDASGKGSHTIDVSAEALGQSDEQKSIDKKIPFTIKTKTAPAPETGQLVVRAAVAPLHIDAPGSELYTDRATAAVAGQTKPAGTLTIDGQAVTLDAQGRFGVRVELPPDGEKTITLIANAPPLAPRTMRAKIVRVASIDAGAKALDAKAPIGFDAYGTDTASKIGKLVVVDGEIVETRVQQGHTVMLVEEKKSCGAGAGACIVRIVHGDEVKAARGDTVHAYARVEGTVSSGGKTIPDVEGILVQSTPAAKPGGAKK